MNETPRRPWWRIHAVSWSVGFVVTLAFIALNTIAPAIQPLNTTGVGWPFASDRQLFWSSVLVTSTGTVSFSPAQQQTTLVVRNVAVAAPIVIGSIIAVERRRRAGRFRLRFTVQTLLVVTACTASFVAIERIRERPWEIAITDFATGVAVAGIIVAWVAFFDVLGIAWNHLTSRRHTIEAPDSESAPPVGESL